MNRKYYYIKFENGKYRIKKEYIAWIQTDSIYAYYYIEFADGVTKTNYEVFEQRRKARQARDKANREYKIRR